MQTIPNSSKADLIEPIHPGEILMEDVIGGLGITQHKLAVSIGVPPRRVNEIVHGKRAITAGGVTNRAVLCPDGVIGLGRCETSVGLDSKPVVTEPGSPICG